LIRIEKIDEPPVPHHVRNELFRRIGNNFDNF